MILWYHTKYIWYNSVSIMAQTLRLSRKCLLQADMTDWLRSKKLDIPEFNSKNMKLTDFNEWFFISLPLLILLADVYAPVHD